MTIQCPFLGLINTPIRTYTQTYSPVASGWQFNGRNTQPMEAEVYVSGSNFQGLKGNIFSANFITPFNLGVTSGTINGNFGSCAYWGTTFAVLGNIQNATGQGEPWAQTFTLNLNGVGITQPSLTLTKLKTLPNLANTGAPSPNIGQGGVASAPLTVGYTQGLMYSWTLSLQNFIGVYDGANNIQGVTDPGYNTSSPTYTGSIPSTTNYNNVTVGNSSGAPTKLYSLANWFGNSTPSTQDATFGQPNSSTLNVNTLMHSATPPLLRPTTLGFLAVMTDTQTVNGVVLNGYCILILPNFAGYYILQITPTDIPSQSWVPGTGTVQGAIGQDGYLFLKQFNNNTTLFISTGPIVLPLNPDAATSRQRAWTYVLDGHTFYVLDLGTQGTFAFDITTQQWSNFSTSGFVQWSVANGVMWGNRIVGGDLFSTDVWEVNGSTLQDNGVDINHIVTGGLAVRGREFISVNNFRMAISKGQYGDQLGSVMNLRFSDDGGQTWSPYFTAALTAGVTRGALSWPSLGSFNAPGRVFEISDSGGPLRIDGADAFIDDFDDDSPQRTQGGPQT